MVSFGFYHKPTFISLKEFEILSSIGLEEDGSISHNYTPQDDYFMFLGRRVGTEQGERTEKQILNACRLLQVDKVLKTPKNSILRLRLRANIVVKKGEKVFYFQTKAGEVAAEDYVDRCVGRKVGIYFPRDSRENKPQGIEDSYLAPGVAYLNTTYGGDTLALFLSELSTWLDCPVKKKYQILLTFLRAKATKKHITSQALETIFGRNAMQTVSELNVFYPIEMESGYVRLSTQRENQRQSNNKQRQSSSRV